MRLSRNYRLLLIVMLPFFVALTFETSAYAAHTDERSAVVNVIAPDAFVLRAGAINELPLRAGAVAPLGAGDRLRTGENGRVVITFDDANPLYLLPETAYTLERFRADDDGAQVSGFLEGIAIQAFDDSLADAWTYALRTDALTITQPSALFAVWAVTDRLEAVISGAGILQADVTDADEAVAVGPADGIFPAVSADVVALQPPYHASQLLALAVDCRGTVFTGGSEGLRTRRGAALDYPIVDVLQDGQGAWIVGITENELWYRIPYQTGFGWLFRDFVQADCSDLPRFPNLVGEANEIISGVTERELDFLEPFYGRPAENTIFYR